MENENLGVNWLTEVLEKGHQNTTLSRLRFSSAISGRKLLSVWDNVKKVLTLTGFN